MFGWVLNRPLKLKIKTPEQCHSHCSVGFIVDFGHISQIGLHAYFTHFTHISLIDGSTVDSKRVKMLAGKVFKNLNKEMM